MRKLLLSFAVVLITGISCSQGEALLLAAKMQANAQCPMMVDEFTTLENVKYEMGDSFFVYNYSIDETKCPMAVIEAQSEVLAESIKNSLESKMGDLSVQSLLKTCIKENVKILYQYSGSESGTTCRIIYSPKDKTMTIQHQQ